MAEGTGRPSEIGRAHRILISVVVAGAVAIAGIGFAGSYAAVRELAERKGFGAFSVVFPIGIDAGIVVLLALDLLLTWIRIPFPLLRQTAWLLTTATVAFNGASAWPDALGVGMHAVIPVLFVVAVEAARHAIGRIADITADKHMEGVRITRWLLSPVPTFLLWRRMKLWELRSYDAVIKLEQERLVYQARLRSRFGRGWRRKAPVESLMPLRLARYGVPLVETAPAGLAAAGNEAPIEALAAPASAELVSADGPQYSPGASEDTTELSGRRGEETSTVAAGVSAREVPERAADLADAFRAYLAQYGASPNSRQFALYLVDVGITDPETGGPLPEAMLRPALQELRRQRPALAGDAMDVVDPKPEQWQGAGTGQPYSSVAEHESASPAPTATAPLPEPVATASATGGQGAHHPVSSATGQGATGQTDVAASARPSTIPPARVPDAVGQPELWETASQNTGEATARKPQPQQQELDPEEQRIEQVVQWLIEAEATGKRLSGAEVARRLQVAPRTGQRVVAAAKEVKEARERQQGRSHLRSVTHRT
ncbi:DUF2637 domain-containing protein [Streptomyces halobius]|uniref:DUF2637 domain-containing protein n=1 Tax=Streptomyces halobius TaxID=2879846 RepID=A0ABY4MI86_9ACTN|nr:DUF2637 domain-containing protein [Streptomyces halobius]UQA97463.1 DUF2637 domain-containing protein [Streptomyces halobius]